MQSTPTSAAPEKKPTWQQVVAKYQRPSFGRSMWQVVNTFGPYLILMYLMYLSLSYSYFLTLLLAIPAGGLLTRIFIIFHDCGHGSFFKKQRYNNFLGVICGLFVYTPYYQWRFEHAIHHATSGDLDRRGTGDIYTMTVSEYMKLDRWAQFRYRLYRSPFVLLAIAPWFTFLVSQRFVDPLSKKRERLSVYFSNLFIVGLLVAAYFTIGIPALLMIQLPVAFIGGLGGVWMFYIQHQFEGTYWEHHGDWDYVTAALNGSSYFKLPKVLQWFTGNIGFHHIHHLSSRIPNYALQQCMEENPLFQNVTTITLGSSFKSLGLNLWDEDQNCMVGFRHLKTLARQQQTS